MPALARIFRGKEEVGLGELKGLKRGPNDAQDLAEGEMGGISISTQGRVTLELGDRLEFFTRENVERTL